MTEKKEIKRPLYRMQALQQQMQVVDDPKKEEPKKQEPQAATGNESKPLSNYWTRVPHTQLGGSAPLFSSSNTTSPPAAYLDFNLDKGFAPKNIFLKARIGGISPQKSIFRASADPTHSTDSSNEYPQKPSEAFNYGLYDIGSIGLGYASKRFMAYATTGLVSESNYAESVRLRSGIEAKEKLNDLATSNKVPAPPPYTTEFKKTSVSDLGLQSFNVGLNVYPTKKLSFGVEAGIIPEFSYNMTMNTPRSTQFIHKHDDNIWNVINDDKREEIHYDSKTYSQYGANINVSSKSSYLNVSGTFNFMQMNSVILKFQAGADVNFNSSVYKKSYDLTKSQEESIDRWEWDRDKPGEPWFHSTYMGNTSNYTESHSGSTEVNAYKNVNITPYLGVNISLVGKKSVLENSAISSYKSIVSDADKALVKFLNDNNLYGRTDFAEMTDKTKIKDLKSFLKSAEYLGKNEDDTTIDKATMDAIGRLYSSKFTYISENYPDLFKNAGIATYGDTELRYVLLNAATREITDISQDIFRIDDATKNVATDLSGQPISNGNKIVIKQKDISLKSGETFFVYKISIEDAAGNLIKNYETNLTDDYKFAAMAIPASARQVKRDLCAYFESPIIPGSLYSLDAAISEITAVANNKTSTLNFSNESKNNQPVWGEIKVLNMFNVVDFNIYSKDEAGKTIIMPFADASFYSGTDKVLDALVKAAKKGTIDDAFTPGTELRNNLEKRSLKGGIDINESEAAYIVKTVKEMFTSGGKIDKNEHNELSTLIQNLSAPDAPVVSNGETGTPAPSRKGRWIK